MQLIKEKRPGGLSIYTTPLEIEGQLYAPIRSPQDQTPCGGMNRRVYARRVGGISIIQVAPIRTLDNPQFCYWRVGFIFADGATQELLVRNLLTLRNLLRGIACRATWAADATLIVGTTPTSDRFSVDHPFVKKGEF